MLLCGMVINRVAIFMSGMFNLVDVVRAHAMDGVEGSNLESIHVISLDSIFSLFYNLLLFNFDVYTSS